MANNEQLGAKKTENTQEKENFGTRLVNFFAKYQNVIYGVIIAILVVIAAAIALNKFYFTPRNQKASAAMIAPINHYLAGDSLSLNLALEGDDENDGFLTIISDYKMTKTANTAKYYAGLCYLKLNDKEEALNYLLQFKKKEDVLWYACQALIGDLYDEQGDESKAISYYKKSVENDDPYFTPINLFKLGQMYERSENWKEADKAYQRIESEYYDQYMSMGVAKFAENVKSKLQ
ncbi:MAG: tetratricopeptide repeat protein [Bacteroidales bacterium]|nr:tetratricopeptide repeat protein [Bacteroidales bacterium]